MKRGFPAIVSILFLAAAVRFGVYAAGRAGAFAPDMLPDSQRYIDLSETLWKTGQFTYGGVAETQRTPGYPILLFLTRTPYGGGLWAAVAAQILLDLGVVVLIYLLGRTLLTPAIGLLAAGFYAVNPMGVSYAMMILTDTPFAFLFLLSFYLLVLHFRRGGRVGVLVGGAAMAAACFIRPIGLAFVAAAGAVLMVRGLIQWVRARKVEAIWPVVLWIAPTALSVFVWSARNSVAADYSGFSSIGSLSLLRDEAPVVLAKTRGVSIEEARRQLHAELIATAKIDSPNAASRRKTSNGCDSNEPRAQASGQSTAPWRSRLGTTSDFTSNGVLAIDDGRFAPYWRGVADRALKPVWPTWLRMHLKACLGCLLPTVEPLKMARLTPGGTGIMTVLRTQGPSWSAVKAYVGDNPAAMAGLLALGGYTAMVYILAMIGVIQCLRPWMGAVGWLAVLAALALLLPSGMGSVPRYRLPIEPLLCLGAAAGWMRLWRGRLRRAAPLKNRANANAE